MQSLPVHVRAHTHTHTHTRVCFCELCGDCIGVMVFILYKLYFLLPFTNPTPKPTPYRKLCIFTFSKKKKFCMIYKPFENGDMGKCPHKSPSPCNTYVIPMTLYKFVSSCHMKKTFLIPMSQKRARARTHTHTHTHTHTQEHIVCKQEHTFTALFNKMVYIIEKRDIQVW